jgi:demethylmenaquinone methyltransferase/2-methoxy-6-polyprenyl-1,4-benzoquinol methylase
LITTSQEPTKLPGTRPEGARDEREAASRVQEMFGKIAPRYDFLNHLLSLSLDRVWRRRTAKRFAAILRRPESPVLDLCCGTGDLAFALERERSQLLGGASDAKNAASKGDGNQARRPVVGGDFVKAMLDRARAKGVADNYATTFVASDALGLPFADAQFELVTAAFGFRNLSNYDKGLREIARVLRPGGEVGILEFSEPSSGVMASVFRFYFQHVLPRVGRALSGNKEAYAYLPASVRKFPGPAELSRMMETAGFKNVQAEAWNFGSVVLHRAVRS